MFDINFYMNVFNLKGQLMRGEKKDREYVFKKMEEFRSLDPVVYNIETTNACNMNCKMCPRTTMMTRPVETLDLYTFKRVVDQIEPFSEKDWQAWEQFVEKSYNIHKDDMSENHFFLYVISKAIVLHGYGDPLLDKDMPARVKILQQKGIPSYFSCNPANINIDRVIEIFESGLDYIKFSIESVDDVRHKEIRGKASNFPESYKRIIELIKLREKINYKTTIVITMIDFALPNQQQEFKKLKEAFEGLDVYLYLKSQDQKWYLNGADPTKSIHWLEFCQFPWSSTAVKSNGEVAQCGLDFNNEIILGDTKTQRLYDIWNGERYSKFRRDHFDLSPGIRCGSRCDMTLIGSLISG